jgi:hypothetical protein
LEVKKKIDFEQKKLAQVATFKQYMLKGVENK